MSNIHMINRNMMTQHEIEQHFFNKGYEYALLHLHVGLEEENVLGLEKILRKYMDFLDSVIKNKSSKLSSKVKTK